eukprot:762789-Hanusia_phi.AAC.4
MKLLQASASPSSLRLEELEMAKMPVGKDGRRIDWGAGVRRSWRFGEEAAKVGKEDGQPQRTGRRDGEESGWEGRGRIR